MRTEILCALSQQKLLRLGEITGELFDVLHPTTRHIAYMNNGTLLPIEIMS
jgi:hypothetical protein